MEFGRVVRNSWGSSWGMSGYINMARDHNNQCGVVTNAIYTNTGAPGPAPAPPPAPEESQFRCVHDQCVPYKSGGGTKAACEAICGTPKSFIAIEEQNCNDAACTQCTHSDSFATDKCLETTDAGLYIRGSCSADGSMIQEDTFNDPKCQTKTGNYPSKTGTCLENTSGSGYTLYTCKTTNATNVGA